MTSLANCRSMLRSSQADKHNDNRALSLPAFVRPAPPAMSARPHRGLDCATPEEVSRALRSWIGIRCAGQSWASADRVHEWQSPAHGPHNATFHDCTAPSHWLPLAPNAGRRHGARGLDMANDEDNDVGVYDEPDGR